MGTVPVLKSQDVVKRLSDLGFAEVRQRGRTRQAAPNSPVYDVQDGIGMSSGYTQQHAGGTVGLPPALLPVLQCLDADAEQSGKLRLRQRIPLPDGRDVDVVGGKGLPFQS